MIMIKEKIKIKNYSKMFKKYDLSKDEYVNNMITDKKLFIEPLPDFNNMNNPLERYLKIDMNNSVGNILNIDYDNGVADVDLSDKFLFDKSIVLQPRILAVLDSNDDYDIKKVIGFDVIITGEK